MSARGPGAPEAAEAAAEMAARTSYGRLVAALARRTGDIAAAEDALGEAFMAALRQWPREGVPQSPEGWLLTVARRRWLDEVRKQRPRADVEALETLAVEAAATGAGGFGDPRLGLLFVCAHPAIRADCHTPLMLQSVLGLDAERIAELLLDSPQALRQRLTRAKAKIRVAGIRFELPEAAALPERLDAVLEAIYGACAADLSGGGEAGLLSEAFYLARLTAELLPGEPEALGLHALLAFIQSRAATRLSSGSEFVPLEAQDASRWNRDLIAAARRALGDAARHRRLGRFQIEAAIQAMHAVRAEGRAPDAGAIVSLYDQLESWAPSWGARVARAVALARAPKRGAAPVNGPAAGLAALDELEHSAASAMAAFQPYWCARAHLLAELSSPEAGAAFTRALALTTDPAQRAYLGAQLARCGQRPDAGVPRQSTETAY